MKTRLSILLLSLLALPASARTISWLNAPGDVLVESVGLSSTLDDSYIFEIGTFGSFLPTEFNLDEWSTNWKVFDRAVTGDGWNGTTDYFTSSAQFLSSGESSAALSSATFMAGEIAYLWVYNSLNLLPTSEWALVRDATADASPAWVIPTSDVGNPNSVDWDLFFADSAIFGQVNGFAGGGDFTPISAPLGVAWLQTAPVPEPSGALLVLFTASLTLLVRRRVKGLQASGTDAPF